MSEQERKDFGAAWLGLAEMYGKEIKPNALGFMLDAVSDLPFVKLMAALKEWARTSPHQRHPLPNELHSIISPTVSSRFVAVDLARKIDRAISKHGYTWEGGYFSPGGCYWEAVVDGRVFAYPSFREAVVAELGEIGWHAICERGGWANIHASQREMSEGQFIAQLRDQVEASHALSEAGVDITKIGMPKPRSSEQNTLDWDEKIKQLKNGMESQ